MTVLLDDGGTVTADLLVAADGINSAVRAQRLPQVRVADLGSRHIVAKIPLTERTRDRVPEQLLNTFSLAYDSHHTGLTFGPLERSDPDSPLIKEQDEEFQAEARENFALTIFNSLTDRMLPDAKLFTASPEQLRDYVVARLAAWHPALVDAHVLGDELLAVSGGSETVVEAIGSYEEQLRDYGFTAVRMSAAVGEQVIGHRPLPEGT